MVARQFHAFKVHFGNEETHVLLDVAAEHRGGAVWNSVTIVGEPIDEAIALLRRKDRDIVFGDVITRFYRYTFAPRELRDGGRRGGAHGRHIHDRTWTAWIRIAILDQPRCRIGVEMIDGLGIDDANLSAFDERRHWDDHCKFVRVALIVACHRDSGLVAIAG